MKQLMLRNCNDYQFVCPFEQAVGLKVSTHKFLTILLDVKFYKSTIIHKKFDIHISGPWA